MTDSISMDGQKSNIPIKYGFLKKIDGSKGMFMLYPDVFAACIAVKVDEQDDNQKTVVKYSPEIALSLEQAQVRDEDQNGQPSFTVVAGFASISVIADSVKQRDDWVWEIRKAIDSLDKRSVVLQDSASPSPSLEKPQENNELMESVADFFTKNPRALIQKMYQKHKRGKSISESENGDKIDVVIKKGYLKKNGSKMIPSKLRWFVLRKKTLSYFETEACECKAPQAIIELNSQVKLYDSQKHTDGFRLSFSDGTLYLQADSVSEKMDWVNAIRKCINSNSDNEIQAGTSSASLNTLTQRNLAIHTRERSEDMQSEEERSSNSAEGYDRRPSDLNTLKRCNEDISSEEEAHMTRSTSMAVFADSQRDEVFDISDNEELDWAEAKSANDWALIEGWLQEFANTVKSGNDTLKYDMKKALHRLKKGTKPFIVLGNDIKNFNRRITGQKKKSSLSDNSEIELKKLDEYKDADTSEAGTPLVSTPVSCLCSQHYENKLIDQIVGLPCGQLFDLIYDPSSTFNRAFAEKRGVKDSKDEIIESGTLGTKESWKKRKVSYYHLVNNPIAKSPFALCIENQNVLVYEENQKYVLEVESNSPEVPYGDYFTAVARYCISFETPTTSKILCHVQLVWKKSSPLKSFVAKLALGALKEHMKEFMNTLIATSGAVKIVTPTSESPNSPVSSISSSSSSNINEMAVEKEDKDIHKKMGSVSIGMLISLIFLYNILPNLFGSVHDLSDRLSLSIRCGVFSVIPIFTALLWSGHQSAEVNHFFKLTFIFILNLIGLSTYTQMSHSMNIIALFTVYHFIGCVAFFGFHFLYESKGVKNPGFFISVSNSTIILLSILFLSF